MAAGNNGKANDDAQGFRSTLFVFVVLFLIAAFVEGFDSFGLSSAQDTQVATLSSVTTAPFAPLTRPPRGVAAQEAVTVLLMDDKTRQALDIDTPYLDYDSLARYIDTLAAARPKAILLDYFYGRYKTSDATDGGLKAFEDALARAKALGVTVYTGPVSDNPALAGIRRNVTEVALGWRGEHELDYPFIGLSDYQGISDTRSLTAAARIYRDLCEGGRAANFDCSQAAPLAASGVTTTAPPVMFLTYQPYIAPKTPYAIPVPYERTADCLDQPTGARFVLRGLARALMRSVNGDDRHGTGKCVSVPHFSLSQVFMPAFDGDAPQVNRPLTDTYITGKVVMIGDGLGKDRFEAPVFGQLDGVFQHAIALQTLLSHGSDYTHWPRSIGVGQWQLTFAFLFEWLVSLLVIVAVRAAMKPAAGPTPFIYKSSTIAIPLLFALGMLIFQAVDHWPPANAFGIIAAVSGVLAITDLDKVLTRRWLTMWAVLVIGIVATVAGCIWLGGFL